MRGSRTKRKISTGSMISATSAFTKMDAHTKTSAYMIAWISRAKTRKGDKKMASIEYIQQRVAGKEKEIEKIEKKIARILKAQASNWEVNPYYYDEGDLKIANRDLENAKAALDGLKADLQTATEKANSRNVKAIVDFLTMWKEHVREWYKASYETYKEEYAVYAESDRKYTEWFNYTRWKMIKAGQNDEVKRIEKKAREERKAFREKWSYIEHYATCYKFDWDRFERDLKNDADAKYDNIIDRTNAICGTITDAAGLNVGAKGDLDGYVKGERGVAHVHTIGAGGYNIQCFHFRVLVHKVGD